MAFYYSNYTEIWVVKSFHEPEKGVETELGRQFRELGLI